jgi:hypothetical protein
MGVVNLPLKRMFKKAQTTVVLREKEPFLVGRAGTTTW